MINSRLSKKFNLDHPVMSAPMANAAGGALAAAVSRTGGLGIIGGAYGDLDWIEDQFAKAQGEAVGCGLITWVLAERPEVLTAVLEHAPAAIFLSFGDPSHHVNEVFASGIPLICQVQTLEDAKQAAELGVDVIVAQGAEAGGHGEKRATFTLVPEIADWLANNSHDTLLVAAGGIADGRGIAASMLLGADGVLVGSRFWASQEALVHPNMHKAAINATGDDTIRSQVMDIARDLNWPERFTCRVLRNEFTDKWHENPGLLMEDLSGQSKLWKDAWNAGDIDIANTFVGEVAGQISAIRPAAEILQDMVLEAEELLSADWLSPSGMA